MIAQKLVSVFAILAIVVTLANGSKKYASKLTYDHYEDSCPQVESVSKEITEGFLKDDPSLAAGLVRVDFHDCFVRGCDASVLLDPTPSNNRTEKTARPNLSLRGFKVIDAIKSKLEEECPGVVSCADVLRLASRDAVVAINGPYWDVRFGRKDGKVSLASEAAALPSPFANIDSLIKSFADLGLTKKDLVVLSGAHTIGHTHCSIMKGRLYNFTGKGDTDPAIDPVFALQLKLKCPPINNDPSELQMDAYTPQTFDGKYFNTVNDNKGVFLSDVALLKDSETKKYIESQVSSKGAKFANDFAESMEKMIEIGVLTGDEGEVRHTCGAVLNSSY